MPVGGGPIQILVVSEHVAHARAAWMQTLRDEFFQSLDGNPPSHHIDLLSDPWPARWSTAFPALHQLLNATAADPLPYWRPIHTTLVGWME